MRRATAIAGFLLLAAPFLSGCQTPADTTARVGGPAQPYARSWSVIGSPRPDLPPDRDGRGSEKR